MKLKIKASSAVMSHSLEVRPEGVRFTETALWGNRSFGFSQIDCVLMAPNQVLSFQVGQEVFSIPTVPGNSTHQATIAALVEGVRRSVGPAVGIASPQQSLPGV